MELKTLTQDVERVSKIYAEKFSIERNDAWFLLKLTEELGELNQSYLKLTGNARTQDNQASLRKNFEDELADVLGQTLLLAKHHDIDLEKAMQRKWLEYLPKS